MEFSHHQSLPYYALSFIFSCFFIFSAAIDTISDNGSLSDSESLISSGGRFKLSFFSPANNSRRYVGIMFNLPVMTVVWVANRNEPLNNSTASLEMSSDGNLVILDGRKEIVWSTNLSTSLANARAVLMDTGNLVLQDKSSKTYWESFNHASYSYLEKMRIYTDLNSNEKNVLTSWRSDDDPATGGFTFTIEPHLDIPQLFIWKDGEPFWRDGPAFKCEYGSGPISIVGGDSPRTAYLTFTLPNSSFFMYYALNFAGSLEEKMWSDEKKSWEVSWSSTSNECDMYGMCGPFGSCNAQEMPICTCFHGFMPKNNDEWEAGNWTSGCTRKTQLQCQQNNSMGGEEDEFLIVEKVKLPDHFRREPSFDRDCRRGCLSNCSCIAYAYSSGFGCLHWDGKLFDAQVLKTNAANDLYIRLPFRELAQKKNGRRTVIATTVVLGFILVAVSAFLLYCRGRKHRNRLINSKIKRTDAEFSEESVLMNGVTLEELPSFKFHMLSNATENFDPVNKLGQGGLLVSNKLKQKRLQRRGEEFRCLNNEFGTARGLKQSHRSALVADVHSTETS